MKNPSYNTQEIKQYMADHKVSRPTAVRHLYKKTAAPAPAVDVKQKAANDKPETREVPAVMTPEERGKARAEGLRLFKLAGRPKKSDFIRVFGKKGVAWTWEARAKSLGVASAEQCASQFQSLLKKASR
jgi:hypothetical protein